MQKIIKQTVYLPVKVEYGLKTELIQEEGYFFTPEQLNEYTQSVIKQALETAARKSETEERHGWMFVNKQSITSTFEETFKRFEV